jgi:hypothetical protein
MIDRRSFELIRRRHGAYCSWAVWAPQSGPPKSGVGDLKVLDHEFDSGLLSSLNPGVVMVGLNISRGFAEEPFRNFHDARASANDFKIRYAFFGTRFWGAYMTDIIKGVVEPSSGALIRWLRQNPQVVAEHVEVFRAELSDLGRPRPVILAFGGAVRDLLVENLATTDYAHIVRLTHYSHRISKEDYRQAVHEQLRVLPEFASIDLQPAAAAGTISRLG